MNTSKRWNIFTAVFLMLELAMSAAAAEFDFNYGTSVWNVAEATKKAHSIGWFQADSWHKDYIVQDADGNPVDLSATNLLIRYDVVAATNLTETWIASTGLVVSGTSGLFRLSLDPEESNIQTGYYYGLVHACTVSGTNLVDNKLLVKQTIQVLWSTDNRYYAFRGPLTYQLDAWDFSNLTATITSIVETVADPLVAAEALLRGDADTNLQTQINGKAAAAHSQGWSSITSTPTTLDGYGITDAASNTDYRLDDARTPTAHNQNWSTVTDTPTTLAGYGITGGTVSGALAAGSLSTTQQLVYPVSITKTNGRIAWYGGLSLAQGALEDGDTVRFYGYNVVTAGNGSASMSNAAFCVENKSNIRILGGGCAALYSVATGDYLGVSGSTNVEISGIRFLGNGPSKIQNVEMFCMVHLHDSEGVRVHDNVFSRYSSHGVSELETVWQTRLSRNVEVYNNFFETGGNFNYMGTNSPDGAAISAMGNWWSVHDNVMRGVLRGIEVQGTNSAIKNVTIRDNDIEFFDIGIMCFGGNPLITNFENVHILNNVLTGTNVFCGIKNTNFPNNGIEASAGVGLTIAGNTVRNHGLCGIIVGSSWGYISDVYIGGNKIAASFPGIAAVNGIQVEDGGYGLTNGVIEGNEVAYQSGYGIIARGSKVITRNNVVHNNSSCGIAVSQVQQGNMSGGFYDNVTYGNGGDGGIRISAGVSGMVMRGNSGENEVYTNVDWGTGTVFEDGVRVYSNGTLYGWAGNINFRDPSSMTMSNGVFGGRFLDVTFGDVSTDWPWEVITFWTDGGAGHSGAPIYMQPASACVAGASLICGGNISPQPSSARTSLEMRATLAHAPCGLGVVTSLYQLGVWEYSDTGRAMPDSTTYKLVLTNTTSWCLYTITKTNTCVYSFNTPRYARLSLAREGATGDSTNALFVGALHYRWK